MSIIIIIIIIIHSQANETVDVAFNQNPIRTQLRNSAFIGEET